MTQTRSRFCDGRPWGWPPMHCPPAASSLAPVAASDRDGLLREVLELLVAHERAGDASLVVRNGQVEGRPVPTQVSLATLRGLSPEWVKGSGDSQR